MHLCKIGLATEGKRVPGLKMPMAQVELRDSEDGDPVLIISWGKRPVPVPHDPDGRYPGSHHDRR